MALVVKDDVKISEFINLSAAEKFLPAVMTSVKTVRISKVDKVIAMENDSLSDVDLLKGVKLVKDGYVCLAGLVVSGEWNLPDNCRGGVSVCLVDKRMQRDDEATLGSYRTSAAKKRFAFKLIPNYSITTADAERNVWQVLVNIRGVAMEKGFCPLSLEFVSVCIVHKSNIKLGLREKITSVSEGGPVELTEAVVDEFIESVPMADRLRKFRNQSKKGSNKYVGKRNDNKGLNKEGKLFDKVRTGQNSESSDAESSSF